MKTNNNDKHCVCPGCQLRSAVSGIIFGVILGLLFYSVSIPFIITGIWIAFGIATFILAYILGVLFLTSCGDSCLKSKCCLRENIKCLLTGSIGTIIISIIALSINLVIQNIPIAILIGLMAFFF
ncbi:MAG: hypothetical protein Q4B84_03380, partial [Clostridia bacterium]|nr:hypothetical protein [Clostridia bacterium]